MERETYEGVTIDRCLDCGGVWVSDEELRAIVKSREVDFSPAEQQQALSQADEGPAGESKTCPVCGERLERFKYAMSSKVILDRCPEDHGVWLDPGELEAAQVLMEEYEQEYAVLDEDLGEAQLLDVKRCPRCDVPLRQILYEDVEIDLCPDCQGTWCDDREMAMVVDRHSKEFSSEDFPGIEATEDDAEVVSEDEIPESYDCPVCGRQLNRVNYQYSSGIIIDNCPADHGTWLDHGELEKVQVFCERWDDSDDLADRYAGALREARNTTETEVQEDIRNLSPSSVGFVNRFFRTLARRGWI
jgi:Zn-finger nucleic acid-binding protein